MKLFRYICYCVSLFSLTILFLPFPFATPNSLHDIFGTAFGEALVVVLIGFLFVCALVLSAALAVTSIKRWKFNRSLFGELLFISFSAAFLFLIIGVVHRKPPSERIFLLNRGKEPEEFVNPYLTFKMVDCRDITEEFDVVFIPGSILNETEYLAFAPRRKDKSIGYIPGRKYEEDWYWEFSGSQWDSKLSDCVRRNKSPNDKYQLR